MKRILLCDDEKDIRDVIEMMLEIELNDGVEVVHAENGHEGIERLKDSEKFDLIICDMNMPQLKGVEVYNFNRDHNRVPFLLLSADCEEDIKTFNGFDSCLRSNYIQKPWKKNDFFDKVKAFLFQDLAA